MKNKISIIYDETLNYFCKPPFNPSIRYPEYPWIQISNQPNLIYEAVRKGLIYLGLDENNINTPRWNPFKSFINLGNTVLIKPNFVIHFHPSAYDINCIITNSSVIRAIVDYVIIALQGRGKIIIGDAPIQSCRIEEILNTNGLFELIDFLRNNSDIEIEFRDLREDVIRLEKHSIVSARRKNPVEITEVKLGSDSKLEGIIQDAHLFCVDGYEQSKTRQSHLPGTHIYDINSLTYEVDAIINIPKLKTHKKAGMTGAIKNFVGLNANKDRLPHFRSGSPTNRGDEYPVTNVFREAYRTLIHTMDKTDNKVVRYMIVSALYLLRRIFKLQKFELIEGGAWPGNDTMWRMINDLTKIIYYGDKEGKIHTDLQRKVLHIVDGIVAGEKTGPLAATPKRSGLILSGFNPFIVDAAASEIMGFNYQKIKTVSEIQELFGVQPSDAEVILNGEKVEFDCLSKKIGLSFEPPYGWDEIVKR